MQGIVILGAGELGATLARRVAERELARRVVLVDADEGKARGKALDLLQSGPVEGYDTRIEGRKDLGDTSPPDALVVADPPELEGTISQLKAGDYVRPLVALLGGRGVLIVAGAHGPELIEAAVARGLPRERALGTAPVAYASALRRRLAAELGVEPREVTATLLGYPPDHLVLPQSSATAGGLPVERLDATAARRALESVRKRALGPVALAAAAAHAIRALQDARPSLLAVTVFLDGEYGHRGIALAVPASVGAGRAGCVVEYPLDPVDRVALDTAAQRRFEGQV